VSDPQPSRAYLVDLDGTLISGGAPLPYAAKLLQGLGERVVLLSNDAEHTPVQLSRSLRAMHLHIPPARIVLAGVTAVDVIAREMSGARTMLLASRALRTHAGKRGLELTDANADVVILGRDRQFNYTRLAAAANAVRRGAHLVVANPDLTHPGPDGTVVPETGSLLAALLACTGAVKHRIIGKPELPMFQSALKILGATNRDAVMIGDNPDTDGRGAHAAGMQFVHVNDWIARH
jgi:HAD superfamily hydrolase (TIGR01450 family)